MLKKISTALIAIWTAAATTACSLSLDISSKIAETQPIADIYTPAVGLPDLSFGGTGYVQHKISLDLDLPDNYGSITRDSDDNIYMIGNIGYRGIVRALNPDGSIKTDFAQNGYFFTGFPLSSDGARINLVNDNGIDYLLVAALTTNEIVLFRLTLNGSLDATYGTDGKVALPAQDIASLENALVHSDGSVFVIYSSWLMSGGGSTGMAVYIQKVRADGVLDTTYGISGVSKAITRADVHIHFQSATLDSLGRVVVLTQVSFTTREVWRVNTSGLLDTTFNTNGSTLFTTASEALFYDVQADASNKVWVFGSSFNSFDMLVYRFTSTGTLDTGTFNAPLGYINSGFIGRPHRAVAAAAGAFRILGRSGSKFAEWNVTSSGVMTLTSNPATSAPFALPTGYTLEYFDGHPLVMSNGDVTWLYNKTAYRQFGNHFYSDSLLYRTKVAQEVDTSFNGGQVRIFNERLATALPSYSQRVKVDSSGRIYSLYNADLGRDGIGALLYRHNSNGTLDSTFGNGGYTLIQNLEPYRLALDSQNRVVIRGKRHVSGFDWEEGVWRLDSSGAPDTSFANGGHIVFTPPPDHVVDIYRGSGDQHPLVIDSSDNILTMIYYYYDHPDDYEDISAVWKITSSGTTATDFGNQGFIRLKHNGQTFYETHDLILNPNGDIHPLRIMEDDDGAERLAMFRIPAGTAQLDGNFGSGTPWKFLVGPELPSDDARGYTPSWSIDPQGRLFVTTYYVTPASGYGDADKVILRRFTSDGNLDTTFLNGDGWVFNRDAVRVWFEVNATTDFKGRVIVVVDEGGPSVTSINWIRALSESGQPDTSFGNSGVISVESLLGLAESPNAWTYSLLTTPSGKILLSLQGESDPDSAGGTKDFFVVVK